jgi:hypothetical protein
MKLSAQVSRQLSERKSDKHKRINKMLKTRATDLHAGKTLRWAGATPFWPAFSRPKLIGVAPAHHACCVTVFCPRAYKDVSNPESRTVSIPNLERSNPRWQY